VKRLEFAPEERPIGIQLYGSAEDMLAEAVGIVEAVEPDFIDINCGCWAKKIAMRGDGAGLLRDLGRFESVVSSVVETSRLPVTVKTRLGWDEDSIVILDAARMVEQSGAKALTVHCRTRNQGYSGEADWRWLERIKKVISIPLVGNGDLTKPEDFARMFETGCDAAMVGRGAITNPWIFKHAKHYLATREHAPPPSPEERVRLCLKHLQDSCAYRGEHRAVKEFRKYYAGYLGGLPGFPELRKELMTMTGLERITNRVQAYLSGLPAEAAASR
jgi:nifR3 family TIM-barrel protein